MPSAIHRRKLGTERRHIERDSLWIFIQQGRHPLHGRAQVPASRGFGPLASLSNKQCDGLSVAEVLKRNIQ